MYDPENKSDTAQVTLEVIPSGPPEGAITSPVNDLNTKYYSDVAIEFSAIVDDAEADPEDLIVSWESNLEALQHQSGYSLKTIIGMKHK